MLRSCCFALPRFAAKLFALTCERVHELHKWFFVIAPEYGGLFAIG